MLMLLVACLCWSVVIVHSLRCPPYSEILVVTSLCEFSLANYCFSCFLVINQYYVKWGLLLAIVLFHLAWSMSVDILASPPVFSLRRLWCWVPFLASGPVRLFNLKTLRQRLCWVFSILWCKQAALVPTPAGLCWCFWSNICLCDFGGGIDCAGLIKCFLVVDCRTDRVQCEVLLLEIDNKFSAR